MLSIRTEQMRALRTGMLDCFVDKLTPLFPPLWPKQTARLGAGYRRFLERSVSRAMSYGIETESAAARFVNLCFVWGADFELRPEHQWALKILKDPKLRGALKVSELAFRTRMKLEKRPANGRGVS